MTFHQNYSCTWSCPLRSSLPRALRARMLPTICPHGPSLTGHCHSYDPSPACVVCAPIGKGLYLFEMRFCCRQEDAGLHRHVALDTSCVEEVANPISSTLLTSLFSPTASMTHEFSSAERVSARALHQITNSSSGTAPKLNDKGRHQSNFDINAQPPVKLGRLDP